MSIALRNPFLEAVSSAIELIQHEVINDEPDGSTKRAAVTQFLDQRVGPRAFSGTLENAAEEAARL